MTEHEFDRMVDQAADRFAQAVERAAGRFEQTVERAAGRFERAMEAGAGRLTDVWDGSALFRWIVCSAELLAGVGLLMAARHFASGGRRVPCFWCAGLGAAALASALLRILLFRRN